jgi:hypothetical protein
MVYGLCDARVSFKARVVKMDRSSRFDDVISSRFGVRIELRLRINRQSVFIRPPTVQYSLMYQRELPQTVRQQCQLPCKDSSTTGWKSF